MSSENSIRLNWEKEISKGGAVVQNGILTTGEIYIRRVIPHTKTDAVEVYFGDVENDPRLKLTIPFNAVNIVVSHYFPRESYLKGLKLIYGYGGTRLYDSFLDFGDFHTTPISSEDYESPILDWQVIEDSDNYIHVLEIMDGYNLQVSFPDKLNIGQSKSLPINSLRDMSPHSKKWCLIGPSLEMFSCHEIEF